MLRIGLALLVSINIAAAQKFAVEQSRIVFFSDALIEDITAENKKASGIFNAANGEIVFSVPIKSFKFAKALMPEHFNEKYMESERFPKAMFQGTVSAYDKTKDLQNVVSAGKLTIHGQTRDVQIPGAIKRVGNKLQMNGKFMVKLADYNIEIPQLFLQNIAEEVEVSVDFLFKPK